MRRIALVAALVALTLGAGSARAAVIPVEGSWKAITSDGLPVYFEVASGRVVNVRFHFRWGFCGTYGDHIPGADLEIDASGRWAYEDPRGQTLEATFVAPDRAEGKLISVERMLPGCPRTEATFTATPQPPNPESLAAARAGIQALPYAIGLREPRYVENTLIGKVSGSLGESFRFVLFVNRAPAGKIDGVPSYSKLTGGRLANTDWMLSTVPKRIATKAQRREQAKILGAVANTVCRRQTGSPCSAS